MCLSAVLVVSVGSWQIYANSRSQRHICGRSVSALPRESRRQPSEWLDCVRVSAKTVSCYTHGHLCNKGSREELCLIECDDRCLYNATTAIYDPVKQQVVEIITYPGITHNPKQHCGGVRWDGYSNQFYALSDAGDAFDTDGEDIAGNNILIKYDRGIHRELWRKNLTELTQGRYGGYQDLDMDNCGNLFIIGTYPSSILRIDADGGQLTTWYGPTTSNTTVKGVTGIAKFGNKFLAPEASSGKLLKFDMGDEKGVPMEVNLEGGNLLGSDAAHLPPIYDNKILLVAVHPTLSSGIAVVESRNGQWDDARYLGEVPDSVAGTLTSVAFSLNDRIYMDAGLYLDSPNKAGNETQFPMVDITEQVAAIVRNACS